MRLCSVLAQGPRVRGLLRVAPRITAPVDGKGGLHLFTVSRVETVFRNDTDAETLHVAFLGAAPQGQPRSFIAGIIREVCVLVICLVYIILA